MPMREDCRHYQSRTYASGEVARWCDKDLAPDAPWRCPADCAGYARRVGDAGWTVGTLVNRRTPPEPDLSQAAELLDQAEDIVNSIGSEVLADWGKERAKRRPRTEGGEPFWRRLFRRR